MRLRKMTRRDLLSRSAAVMGGTAVLGLSGRDAAAFKIEEVPPASGLAKLYASRCGQPTEHDTILRTLQARLAESAAKGERSDIETATCPICGCRIVATADADPVITPQP